MKDVPEEVIFIKIGEEIKYSNKLLKQAQCLYADSCNCQCIKKAN